jgi:hypothetical protein
MKSKTFKEFKEKYYGKISEITDDLIDLFNRHNKDIDIEERMTVNFLSINDLFTSILHAENYDIDRAEYILERFKQSVLDDLQHHMNIKKIYKL